MKLLVTKASDYRYEEFREFNSLEELVDLAEAEGYSLILGKHFCAATEEYALGVMIYDDYIE